MTEYGKELDTLLSENAANPLPSPPPYAQVVREREEWRKRAIAAEGELSLLRKSLDEVARERDGYRAELESARPFADCYKRVCESLGIERDILGYVKTIIGERDEAVRIAEANIQSEIADGGKSCHWCMEKTRQEERMRCRDIVNAQITNVSVYATAAEAKAVTALKRHVAFLIEHGERND